MLESKRIIWFKIVLFRNYSLNLFDDLFFLFLPVVHFLFIIIFFFHELFLSPRISLLLLMYWFLLLGRKDRMIYRRSWLSVLDSKYLLGCMWVWGNSLSTEKKLRHTTKMIVAIWWLMLLVRIEVFSLFFWIIVTLHPWIQRMRKL
jgi:hypothetical protein